MPARRYAILLDGAFVCKRLYAMRRAFPSPSDIITECKRIGTEPSLVPYELLRIYFYDAPPATGLITNPLDKKQTNLGRTATFTRATSFQDALELTPNVALRKGEVSVLGWRLATRALSDIAKTGRALAATDLEPHVQQKGVDLRIGLDIARLSLQRLVDAIVVVTGDSDLVPAFKFARREGIRVYLDHLGHGVKRDLKAHVDVVL